MADVARRTGARIIDLAAEGGREVASSFLYPRRYFVTNAWFDADVVINAANFRSHVGIGISGAVKNMFGCVLGLRKQAIHNLFPGDPARFGRTLADIYRAIPADLSFLDLTTVAEAAGSTLKVQPVGLILAGTDPVALDTVGAHAIGYENLSLWTNYYGAQLGLGCNEIGKIRIQGMDWTSLEKRQLCFPASSRPSKLSAYGRVSHVANNTFLRPRPVIHPARCTGCGDCAIRCPVDCIKPGACQPFTIDLASCVDCGCCLKTCETGAVTLEFRGAAKLIRTLIHRLPRNIDPKRPNPFDPAAMN